MSRYWLGVIIVAGISLDRLIKSIFDLWGEVVTNEGIALGIPLPRGWAIAIALVGSGLLGWRLFYKKALPLPTLTQLALAGILAGALGNALDRIFYGHVIDYLALGNYPVFNLADVLIVGGCALAGVALLKKS